MTSLIISQSMQYFFGEKLQKCSVERPEHFDIHFGYSWQLFPRWISPFKSHVTIPTLMAQRYSSRGDLFCKIKIDFLNNLTTASVLVESHAVLHEIQQLGYLNSNLMLRWDSAFKNCAHGCVSRELLFSFEIGGTLRHCDVICGRTMILWTKILTCVKLLRERDTASLLVIGMYVPVLV